jgi:hypothetical protein
MLKSYSYLHFLYFKRKQIVIEFKNYDSKVPIRGKTECSQVTAVVKNARTQEPINPILVRRFLFASTIDIDDRKEDIDDRKEDNATAKHENELITKTYWRQLTFLCHLRQKLYLICRVNIAQKPFRERSLLQLIIPVVGRTAVQFRLPSIGDGADIFSGGILTFQRCGAGDRGRSVRCCCCCCCCSYRRCHRHPRRRGRRPSEIRAVDAPPNRRLPHGGEVLVT